MTIRVVVADDQEVVRQGLAALFTDTDITIVGEAVDGNDAVRQTLEHRPDVLLLDVRMPEVDGIDALERIRQESPDTRVVMLSMYDNPTYVARTATLGVNNYMLKDAGRDELIDAVRHAAAGAEAAPDSHLQNVRTVLAKRREPREERGPLTNREMQVLRHLALGLSNREIGHSLKISVETVKEHVQNILRKLEMKDRTQAAVMAVRKGLVN